jgi:predicted RNA binding protein YcfA (HicA-like mRNA interferase family)
MSYSRQKVMKALQNKGCRFLREGGRHTIFTSGEGKRVEVPRHRELPRGTARNIARQAGIDWQDFEQAIS